MTLWSPGHKQYNAQVVGVPMMVGSKEIEGYIPEYDDTVVTRMLDAGRYRELSSHDGRGKLIEGYIPEYDATTSFLVISLPR